MNESKVLVIKNSLFLSKEDINMRKYALFSKKMSGLIIQRVVDPDLKKFAVGKFRFSGIYLHQELQRFKILANIYFFFGALAQIAKEKKNGKFNFILASDPFNAGLMGWLFSKILNAKLIVEVNGSFGERKCWGAEKKYSLGSVKYHYCQVIVPFVINRSHGAKLLYPKQLDSFRRGISNPNISVFHEFVPVSTMRPTGRQDKYILFLGAPWHVKGVDLLIRAYLDVCADHDGILRILCWMSEDDRAEIKRMTGGNKQISIEYPVYYEEAISIIDGCEFLVLPSRTEAMGRVLIEAMALQKAVIGSSADGIPHYVNDEVNGLVFESGDWQALAGKLGKLIHNHELRDRLALEGSELARTKYSEDAYLENYLAMLDFKGQGASQA